MNEILMWILGIALTAFAGTGAGALIQWIKTLSFIKKLNIDSLIDKAAEYAVHYAEAIGRSWANGGSEKMEAAKDAFQAELQRQGIKMEAGDMGKRLESIFNKLKPEIEAWKSNVKEVTEK